MFPRLSRQLGHQKPALSSALQSKSAGAMRTALDLVSVPCISNLLARSSPPQGLLLGQDRRTSSSHPIHLCYASVRARWLDMLQRSLDDGGLAESTMRSQTTRILTCQRQEHSSHRIKRDDLIVLHEASRALRNLAWRRIRFDGRWIRDRHYCRQCYEVSNMRL